jgi:hypothetical protein
MHCLTTLALQREMGRQGIGDTGSGHGGNTGEWSDQNVN